MTLRNERGGALLVVVTSMVLVMTLAAALALTTSSETLIASSFRGGLQALYGAEASLEWALLDLMSPDSNWTDVASGVSRSAFVDGPAGGTRALADGTVVDLTALVQQNAAWQLYAYGRLSTILAEPANSAVPAFYVVVFVASNPAGQDVLSVHTESFGLRGAHRVIEAVISRDAAPRPRLVSWREVR